MGSIFNPYFRDALSKLICARHVCIKLKGPDGECLSYLLSPLCRCNPRDPLRDGDNHLPDNGRLLRVITPRKEIETSRKWRVV